MSQAVFISYAARDKKVADGVCRALEDNGVRCWIAPRNVLPGMEYAAAIIDALNSCQVFLVIFSETSNSSPQVAREVERAISKNRTILTFRIDNAALSKAMEYYLSDRHWLDASSGKLSQHLDSLVKAVKALVAAKPPASPGDESIERKKSAAEAAEEKRQLEELLGKAEAAIKSARWDEAIESLNAALAIQPEQTVEAKLADVRSQQHAARLVEFKTRAQALSQAGQFDQAIQTWNDYLALKPDDREEIENKLQDLHEAAIIARDYGKAQELISRKHYDQAIGLLQGIIAREPAYKDSSRFLSEALQAKKSIPVWHRQWAFELTGAVVAILLGVFFGPKLWAGLTRSMQPAPLPAKTDSLMTTFPMVTALSQAPATSEALDPIPALPTDLVSLEPVLVYVKRTPPDFADDFSKPNPAWDPFQAGITLNDGVLRMVMQAGTPTEKIGPSSGSMNAQNFWLELDFFFFSNTSDAEINEGFASTGDGSGTNCDIGVDLPKQLWFMGLTDNSIGKSGHLSEPLKGKWSHLLLIYSNNQAVVFLDGKLLDHVENIPKSGNDIWIIGTTTGQAEIWLDNLKFWKLDSIIGSTAPSGPPANSLSTATAKPEPLPAFVSSVQTYMAGHAPSIADDFSKANPSWGQFPAGATLNDGVLLMSPEAGTPSEKTWLNIPALNIRNFGLEYDFYYEGGKGDTNFNIYFSSTGAGSGASSDIGFNLATGDWSIGLLDNPIRTSGNLGEPLIGKWVHLQMVLYKGQVVEFLNGKLLGHVEGIGSNTGDTIGMVANTTGQAKIRLDNVKFWDLDNIPNVP